MPEQTAIFLHIPKTAGITLYTVIERQYPRSQIYSTAQPIPLDYSANIAILKKAKREQLTGIRMLMGHMAYGLHVYLPNPASYFTLLRDPVERVISFYRYVQHTPTHFLHHYALEPHMTLQKFVNSKLSLDVDNLQTRLLAGVWYDDAPYGAYGGELLEVAKRNLRQCAVVGLMERFDETLLLLKHTYQWRNIFYIKHNIGQRFSDLTDLTEETLEAIRDHNRLDLHLYQYAQSLLEEQLRQQGFAFKAKLRSFQAANQVYQIVRTFSLRVYLRTWWTSHFNRPINTNHS